MFKPIFKLLSIMNSWRTLLRKKINNWLKNYFYCEMNEVQTELDCPHCGTTLERFSTKLRCEHCEFRTNFNEIQRVLDQINEFKSMQDIIDQVPDFKHGNK